MRREYGPGIRVGITGLAPVARRHYVRGMQFFARMSPLRALRDLRLFLHQRQKHELFFLFLSMFMTGLLLIGFAKDSRVEKIYKPEIIYVQQWRLDRTDDEIRAQQAIDGPIKQKMIDEREKRLAERRAQFQRLEEKMDKWGL